jgi:hypothetical protein
MTASFADLYWLPVGAGTKGPFQQWSLWLWEGIDAAVHRRPRAKLVHSALKLGLDAERFVVELSPAFAGELKPPAMTGPVGFRGADRLRFFRYQLRCLHADQLPDEAWVVQPPSRVSEDREVVARLLALTAKVPAHTWGRRAPGTSQMWTSDSSISWLLEQAGLDVSRLGPPPGSRAPGWFAGIEAARRQISLARARG